MRIRATVAEARGAPLPDGRLSPLLMAHGSMTLRYYAPPADGDPQQPHNQDELYIVERGSGTFFMAGERVACEPGDVLFAPAAAEHRFEDYSDDFALWVVFYGPEGGET